MAEKKFSIGEAIQYGWDTMKSNFWFFVGILVVALLIYLIPDVISNLTKTRAPAISVLFSIAGAILNIIIQMGMIKIALKFCNGVKPVFGDLFSCIRLFFKYLFGSILYGLIIAAVLVPAIVVVLIGMAVQQGWLMIVGFVFFIPTIVFSVILGIKLQFFAYFIIDKNAGPVEGLKQSAVITRGAKWDLFILGLLLGLINMVGALCLMIGLFATIPLAMVAVASVYRKLAAAAGISGPEAPAPSVGV